MQFLCFHLQNTYKSFILECLASYKVEKMPYAILPKVTPSGAKKVNVLIYSHSCSSPDTIYVVLI